MLKTRLLTALVLAPLGILGVLYLPTHWFQGLVAVLFLVALWEWTRLIGYRRYRTRTIMVLGNALAMAVLAHVDAGPWLVPVMLVGFAWWCTALWWLGNFNFAERPGQINKLIKTLAGTLIVLPAFASAVYLHGHVEHGRAWTLVLLGLIWAADISAYFAGRRYGTIKLAPKISPGKTRAGLWGALMGSGIVALVAGLWLKLDAVAVVGFIGLALVTVLFSVAGDLFESLIKRHSNSKDSGRVFPGHGGAFDRFDSLFAALPVFALGKLLLGL
jgi:phosphatidate cytidylyltransferase